MLSLLLLSATALAPPDGGAAEEALALLADRCFACHGPDGRAREAELRLDTRAGAFGDRGGYAAVVPGDVGSSELVARITADDADRMPPADSGLALAADEIETLRSWIAAGAPWREHWAFVAPRAAAPPPVERSEWPRDDLDRFVLARLEAAGVAPAPEATPAELVRRVTLDLTGLPPTPEDVAAFVADPSDAAYAALVERLLASPRYGERMAWDWLDAARYADTDGFQADPTRDMWPWRDWLVDALNRNVPFDRLTIELLAGDLLPDATPEQVLASGFNRNHATNGEGGRIREETRVENVFDRVETTGTVWLGLTLECARCHDHKFDPVTQVEYFGLFDFFNQTSADGRGGGGRAAPVLRYLGGEERARTAAIEAEIATLERRRTAPDPALDVAQATWEAEVLRSLRDAPEHAAPLELGAWLRAGVFPAPGGDGAATFDHAYAPESDAEVEWEQAEDLVDGEAYELSEAIGANYLARRFVAPSERTVVLSLGSDDALRVWFDGAEVLVRNVARGVAPDQDRVELDVAPGAHELLFKVVNTGGRAGFYFHVLEERALGLPAELRAALARPAGERDEEEQRALTRAYRARNAEWWDEVEARLAALGDELRRLRDGAPAVMVMDALPPDRRRTTRVLARGGYDQPGEAVEPGVPAFLPPLPAQDSAVGPRDRLTLARWLVAPENPLTARVFVNRAWQTIFGRGLVATPEDFGRQGDAPSHPALLDTLAREFVDGGWDVKDLHRRLVTSSTYRQSAVRLDGNYADDPDNVLLARAPRHRLPAWMLRDQALALGGLLVEQRGGPPVRPYQPEGVWAEATFGTIRYVPDEGDALYRRSLYVFWRRIVGPTVFFDDARRQTCEVRTSRTNTPLHALVTLNETVYVEAARKFAERAHPRAEGDAGRVAWAFRAATARAPEAAELDLLLERLDEARAHFAAHPDDAGALLAVGASPADASIAPADLAAHAVVCAVILNLDEVLTRP